MTVPVSTTSPVRDVSAEIVVIGSGLAGLAAAETAAENNLDVLLVESDEVLGGTTRFSDGVFNAVDPKRQVRIRVEDSPEKHLEHVLRRGRARNHEPLARIFCYEAPSALAWLEHLGFTFRDEISQEPGAPYPRSHVPAEGRGEAYIRFFRERFEKRGLRVLTRTKVLRLQRGGRFSGRPSAPADEAPVRGVIARSADGGLLRITASKGVVLAGGGYQKNATLLRTYSPLLNDAASIGAPGCDGSLMLAAADIGAEVIHTGYYDWTLRAADGTPLTMPDLRNPAGFILLNEKGERFCREDLDVRSLAEVILTQPHDTAWLVRSAQGESVQRLPFSEVTLRTALRRYEQWTLLRVDQDFGKAPELLVPITGEIRIDPVEPVVLSTLGGVLIDENARVIGRDRRPIPGLTAAGDIAGGIFGAGAATGDNLSCAVVFGRLAVKSLSRN